MHDLWPTGGWSNGVDGECGFWICCFRVRYFSSVCTGGSWFLKDGRGSLMSVTFPGRGDLTEMKTLNRRGLNAQPLVALSCVDMSHGTCVNESWQMYE